MAELQALFAGRTARILRGDFNATTVGRLEHTNGTNRIGDCNHGVTQNENTAQLCTLLEAAYLIVIDTFWPSDPTNYSLQDSTPSWIDHIAQDEKTARYVSKHTVLTKLGYRLQWIRNS